VTAPRATYRYTAAEKALVRQLLRQGRTNAEIAAALGRSPMGVQGLIARLREREDLPRRPRGGTRQPALGRKSGLQ